MLGKKKKKKKTTTFVIRVFSWGRLKHFVAKGSHQTMSVNHNNGSVTGESEAKSTRKEMHFNQLPFVLFHLYVLKVESADFVCQPRSEGAPGSQENQHLQADQNVTVNTDANKRQPNSGRHVCLPIRSVAAERKDGWLILINGFKFDNGTPSWMTRYISCNQMNQFAIS